MRTERGRREEQAVFSGDPTRLDRAVAVSVAGVSRGRARRLIDAGSVFLNGRRCRVASRLVRAGDRLRVALDGEEEALARATPFEPIPIVYEDEVLIAVDKPAGMPTAPTRRAAAGTAREVLAKWLARRDGRAAQLWVVHRLDAGTSGLALFARDAVTARSLSEAFHGRAVEKTYVALVDGELAEETGAIALPIEKRGARAFAGAGKSALSEWRVIERRAAATLLALAPRTGRMHQLRVHLAAIGHPIVGDRVYGGSPAPRLMLHAAALGLFHPRTGAPLVLDAPLPAELGAARN